jgi:hypothetical protein
MALARLEGIVIKGFGRGGKDLGCPTGESALQRVLHTVQACAVEGPDLAGSWPSWATTVRKRMGVADLTSVFVSVSASCCVCVCLCVFVSAANLDESVVNNLPASFDTGIYHG